MQRIVVIAASNAGIRCAARIKRRLLQDEVNIVIPAKTEDFHQADGLIGRQMSKRLPDLLTLEARETALLDADSIMTDLENKEITISSSRGNLPVRYDKLIVEVLTSARVPRSISACTNVLSWPINEFTPTTKYDQACIHAIKQQQPIMIVGAGMTALDAVLTITQTGCPVIWLATQQPQEPWIESHLWQFIYREAATDITYVPLPCQSAELTLETNSDRTILEHIVSPDGTRYTGDSIIWTDQQMAKHPLLREEGFVLDGSGRIAKDNKSAPDVFLIGNGATYPMASFAGKEMPVYTGGAEASDTTASYVVEQLVSGQNPDFIGLFGIRRASNKHITICRAGWTATEAEQAGFTVDQATFVYTDTESKAESMALTLIVDTTTQKIIGVQVAGYQISPAAADGLFTAAFTLLTTKQSVHTAMLQEHSGITGYIIERCLSILYNKLNSGIMGITPDELIASEQAGASFFILDLRAAPQWLEKRIPNAYNIPLPQLKKRLQNEVPHFTPLVLVSATGASAYCTACRLKNLGATDLYVLEGGMQLWHHSTESGQI